VLERARAGIAFLDPPYKMSKEYSATMAALDRSETPIVVAQYSSHSPLEEAYGGLKRYRVIKQGDNSLGFYRRAATEEPRATPD
jgi:16S rRNA G966 N2-methylase RsmD